METSVPELGALTSENSELDAFLDSIPVGHRRPRFKALAEGMLSANRTMMILETGCMRLTGVDPREIDGCSTLVWDYVAKCSGGKCVSVDMSQKNCDFAKSQVSIHTDVVCCESVRYLSNIGYMAQPFDFAYLDSMDFNGTIVERQLAALHHAAELATAWRWLAPGALIAVDDCVGEYAGKHAIVKRFFDSIGVEPLCDDYIHVWRKPLNPDPVHFGRAV
jgi:hypothetical protein